MSYTVRLKQGHEKKNPAAFKSLRLSVYLKDHLADLSSR